MHHAREHEEGTKEPAHGEDSIAEPLPERVALARKVRWETFVASAAANVLGAALVAAYLLLLSPGETPPDFHVGEAVALLAVYLAVTIGVGDVLSARPSRAAQSRMVRGLPVSPV